MERKGILSIPARLYRGDQVFILKPGFSFIHRKVGTYLGYSIAKDLISVQVGDTILNLKREEVYKVEWVELTSNIMVGIV